MKKCNKCNIDKPLNEFHKHRGRKLGVTESCKDCRNTTIVEERYNLKQGELQKMRNSQNNLCAICGTKPLLKNRNLAVDHCHKTGKVRGLLCTNCNNGLGRFKDSKILLNKSIKYLEKYE